MSNLFTKIFAKNAPVSNEPLYKEARSMDTCAFHIELGEGNVLCGSSRALYGHREVTVESVVSSLPQQHSNWYWCGACTEIFTGIPAAEVRAFRRD